MFYLEEAVNLPQTIIQSVNTIFSNFFTSLDSNIYSILDDIVFINSDVLNDSFINNILGNSPTSGLLLLCNSLLFGFILYYLISLILSHIVLFKLQTPYQFVCKLIIISILVNHTYDICAFLLDLNSNISLGIRSIGEDLFKSEICFSALESRITPYISDFSNSFNLFSIQGFLKSFSSVGILNLVLSYSLRYIMIKVFILLFPFAIISLLNETTSYFVKSYIKSFISLLFSQSVVALILLITFSLDFTNNILFSQVIFIGSIYCLSRVNYFMKELMGGITTTVYSNASNLKTLFKGGF